MSGHTPGPWYVSTGLSCLIDSDGGMIGRCDVTDFRHDRSEENLANALLIQAAPDLLEAAHSALAQLTGGFPGDPLVLEWFPATETVHALARAIAKAEGR